MSAFSCSSIKSFGVKKQDADRLKALTDRSIYCKSKR